MLIGDSKSHNLPDFKLRGISEKVGLYIERFCLLNTGMKVSSKNVTPII